MIQMYLHPIIRVLAIAIFVAGFTAFSTVDSDASTANNGRLLDPDNLGDGIQGAWIWDRDSNDNERFRPPMIYYFYDDGTFEYLWWPGKNGYEDFGTSKVKIAKGDTTSNMSWEGDDEEISTLYYYHGNLSSSFTFFFDGCYTLNGHTVVRTYHQSGDPCELIPITDSAYADFKNYVGKDWKNYDYARLRPSHKVLKSIQSFSKSKVSLSSIKGSKKAVKMSWKAKKKVSGYQIQYSERKDFSTPKIITVKKAGTTSKKITGLKENKRYYVRVRAYKKIYGHTYYSSWSSKATAKTK